jgi:hypothetical protein
MSDHEDREFAIANGIVEDCRRYIAAHKVQRWDILKWGVSVNAALAAAATAVPALKGAQFLLLIIGYAVALVSCLLIAYYNKRTAGTRQQVVRVINWLKSKGIDYDAIAGGNAAGEYAAGEQYDRFELRIFFAVLLVSPTLILLNLLP